MHARLLAMELQIADAIAATRSGKRKAMILKLRQDAFPLKIFEGEELIGSRKISSHVGCCDCAEEIIKTTSEHVTADRFKASVTQSIAEAIAKLPAFETSTTSLGPDGQFTMAIQAKFRSWVLNLHPMAPLDKTCAEPLANDSEIVDDRASLFCHQQRTSIKFDYLPPHRALAMTPTWITTPGSGRLRRLQCCDPAPALASSMGRLINLHFIKLRLNQI